MIYVVAGNYRQAREWARRAELQERKDWTYVSHPEHLYGVHGPITVARVGTYYDHQEARLIAEEIGRIEAIYGR